MPHLPLYLVTPYKGVDIDKRERRHRTPKQNRQTMKLNEILSPAIRQVMKPHRQEPPMWQQRQSADSDFCRAVVANGYMTSEQMQEAVARYRLGCSRDGGVIFWQIDTLEQICDGKIMYYRPDCHRDHQRGTHLLATHPHPLPVWRGVVSPHAEYSIDSPPSQGGARDGSPIAVVEAEKTAVIMSAHYPQYLWLAAGGLTELTAQKLFPLRHHRIVLFPDTDPDQTAYKRWYTIAQEARRLYDLDIHVSSLLERRATAAQKQAKIDLVDFLF